MKIDLEQIVDEPFDWREALQIPIEELEQVDLVALSEVQCRGRIRALPPAHLLNADLSYTQALRCTRCLEPFDMEMVNGIEFVVERQSKAATTEELELSEEDLGVLRLQGPDLETRPLIVEQLHLGIPMKPLCREDCAGICSQCGAILNAGPCACRPAADPRWAALGKLRS